MAGAARLCEHGVSGDCCLRTHATLVILQHQHNIHSNLAVQEAVEIINSAYPEEIVRYYSPAYSRQLLEKLDAAAAAVTVA